MTNKAYNHTGNWWANPGYPNQWLTCANPASVNQQQNNWDAYPKRKSKRLPRYNDGVLPTTEAKKTAARFPVEKYFPADNTSLPWCPVTGGRSHFAKPTGKCPIKETAPLEAVNGDPKSIVPGGVS